MAFSMDQGVCEREVAAGSARACAFGRQRSPCGSDEALSIARVDILSVSDRHDADLAVRHASTDLPRRRPRRRRRHAHEIRAAEGAARARGPLDARPCRSRPWRAPAHNGSAVVVGPEPRGCREGGRRTLPGVEVFVQRERLGTAHAVLSARGACSSPVRRRRVAFADTPLVSADTFARPAGAPRRGARPSPCSASRRRIRPATAASSSRTARLAAIREHRDATDEERGNHPLQCRPHGAPRRRSRWRSSKDRQPERQGRVLPHRRRRGRADAAGLRGRGRRRARGGGPGHQRPRASSPAPRGDPAAPAQCGHGGRRHADRAGDGFSSATTRGSAGTS